MAMVGQGVTALIFWLLVILSCAYATAFGRRDGAIATAMVVSAALLSAVAETIDRNWGATNLPAMAVDVLLLGGLGVLAFRSRSFWPMWMTAAQLLAVVTHLASMLATGFSQKIYAGLEAVWAIPCLASMVVGIALDRRVRRRPRQ